MDIWGEFWDEFEELEKIRTATMSKTDYEATIKKLHDRQAKVRKAYAERSTIVCQIQFERIARPDSNTREELTQLDFWNRFSICHPIVFCNLLRIL